MTGYYGLNFHFKNYKNLAKHWWLTLVILGTQEAEVRRIRV
jgi:hypothetical protein